MNLGINVETIQTIDGLIVGIIVIVTIVNILTLPFQLLFKLIVNAVIGAVMLYVINLTGFIAIKITLIHSLIAGIFGIPGVIGLIIYNYFLK